MRGCLIAIALVAGTLLLLAACGAILELVGEGSEPPSRPPPPATTTPSPKPTDSQLREIVLAITDACIEEANRIYSVVDPERVDFINLCEIELIGREYLREYCSTLDMRYRERNGRWNCV